MSNIKLPELGYEYNALEPHIDGKTMEIHHTKHHQAYIDNLLKALKEKDGGVDKDYTEEDVLQLIRTLKSIDAPEAVLTQIRNNGGGHINHTFFWRIIGPGKGGSPSGSLGEAIVATFGSFDQFKDQFAQAAAKRFGSGWAWLVKDKSGKLEVLSTPNQDSPETDGKKPILGIDVWEHAYYLNYQNRRPDYVKAFWNIVNWDEADRLYNE